MASFFNRPVEAWAHGHVFTAKAQSLGIKASSQTLLSVGQMKSWPKRVQNKFFSLFSTFFLFSAKKKKLPYFNEKKRKKCRTKQIISLRKNFRLAKKNCKKISSSFFCRFLISKEMSLIEKRKEFEISPSF